MNERAPDIFQNHSAETLYVRDGSLSEHAVEGATSIYIEVVEAKPVFVVVGGGHVGRAVAKLADFLDFHVAVIDDREDFANAELIPEADEVICEDFEVALRKYPIDANTSIVLVTRGHKQDELSLRCCLSRGAGYLGMIGSKRRTTTVLEHLLEEGFPSEELAKIRTPIGLEIGAETPEEIALSIIAEAQAALRGRSGTPLRLRDGPIHR